MTSLDEQRLAFGSVAQLYDRARPSYPATAIDDVIAGGGLAAGDRVLEVGAGTGKATALLAERGLRVLALEPSAAMAALARARTGEGVEVLESDFECWEPDDRYAAVVSVQAWHWVAPDVRYERADAALADGGTLAVIWTFPDWSSCLLRDELGAVYSRMAPQLVPDFPMHPASQPTRLAGDWAAEIEASGRFADPSVTVHRWTQPYSSAAYAELLQTHQDHILMPAAERGRLLDGIGAVIDRTPGARLTMSYETWVCLARRR